MHLALVTVGATGHVLMTPPLVAELVRRGVRVTFFTSENFRATIEPTGAHFVPVDTVLTDQGKAKDNIETDMMAELPLRFLSEADAAIGQILPVLQADPPDAVLSDALAIAGRLAASALHVPLIMLHTSYACNEHFSVTSAWPPVSDEHPARAAAKELAQKFTALYGVEHIGIKEIFEGKADLDLVTISRRFHPAGETFSERYVFIGAQIGQRLAVEGWQAPDGNAPLVYSSLGTLFNNWPEFYIMLAEAVKDLPVRVIASIGSAIRPEQLGRLPDNMRVAPFLPQLDVLSQASLFLTHAGTGSVMEAVYYGVPMLCLPQMDEQIFTAMQVQEQGLGRAVPDKRLVTPTLLRDSIVSLLADQACRARVQAYRQDMLDEGGYQRGADAVLRFLTK